MSSQAPQPFQPQVIFTPLAVTWALIVGAMVAKSGPVASEPM